MSDISVTRNDADSRYEVHVDDELAGVIEFHDDGDRLDMVHTEVFEKHRGGPVASTLASEALADAAHRDRSVIPSCPYIARYLDRHEVPGLTVERP